MRGTAAAALGAAALCACLEAPRRGGEGGGDGGGVEPGEDGSRTTYRRTLEIAPSSVEATLTDFPVLVRIEDDAGLAGHATLAGDDISFHSVEGDPFAYQIERWSDGDLLAWVKLPTIADDAPTTFYLLYGPGAPRVDEPAMVWGDDFAAVWHLEEPPAEATDSTGGGHDAVAAAGTPTSTEGPLGQAVAFDGASDYIDFGSDFPAAVDEGSTLTVTAWVRYDVKQDWGHFVSKAFSNQYGWGMGIDGQHDFMVRAMNGSDFSRGWSVPAEPATGIWYHWAMVFHGTSGASSEERLRAYRDGEPITLSYDDAIPSTFDSAGGDLYIGCATWRTVDYCIEGAVDEVRVSTEPRSAAWIAAEADNQRVGSEFVAVGPEEKL